MTKHSDDLSARARRGALTDEDTAALRQALRASAEARLTHRAGLDFDREDAVQPGDEALAERVVRRVLADRAAPGAHRKRPIGRLLAAALLATGAAAAAAGPSALRVIETWTSSEERAALEPAAAQPNVPAPARLERPPRPPDAPAAVEDPSVRPDEPAEQWAPVQVETPQRPLAADDRPSALSPRWAGPERAPSSLSPQPEPPTSASLFHDANRARREGDVSRAIALYQAIQRDFPSAPEAPAADMPLGLLYAQTGATDRAVQHFERYLTRAPGGALAPEALFSLAQAHERAGKGAEARRVWSDLLSRFPDSAYAGAARGKLQAPR